MTRAEFINAIVDDTKLDAELVVTVVNSAEYILMETLRKLEPVRPFKGIKIDPRIKKGGEHLNPKTLDKVYTEDKIVCKAVFSKVFNDSLNEVDEEA